MVISIVKLSKVEVVTARKANRLDCRSIQSNAIRRPRAMVTNLEQAVHGLEQGGELPSRDRLRYPPAHKIIDEVTVLNV